MTGYTIRIQRRTLKQLAAIANPFRQRIEQAIDALATNPYPRACKKMEGEESKWRLRVGDYRVLYRVAETVQIIEIDALGHRQSIYKH